MPIMLPTTVTDVITEGSANAALMGFGPLHWWTLNRASARVVDGITYINPRNKYLTSTPLVSFDDAVAWASDGIWEVPNISVGPGFGKFYANIPNPGPVYTVLETATHLVSPAYSWGAIYAGLQLDSGLRNVQGTAVFEVNNAGSSVNGGVGVTAGVRSCKATVVNLSDKIVAQAINGSTFTEATTTTNATQIGALAPQPDTTVRFEFGRAGSGDPFNGRINDVMIIAGDVRTQAGLWAAYNEYCLTGWV